MEATYGISADRVAELERRICALEARAGGGFFTDPALRMRQEAEALVLRHGEAVDKTAASRILGVTRVTVYAMLADGRVAYAADGRRVDVASIAAYLTKKAESNARRSRSKRTRKTEGKKHECA
ncbi:MAG: hypothetical protein J6K32_09815 [Clostridia bacterium]|nr:hypothetical protein [Clostridia bacterium]